MKRLLLCAPLLLAACASPQAQCVSEATRDLTIVSRLVSETEKVIARGYALDRETQYRRSYRLCRVDEDRYSYCWVNTPVSRLRPVAVDLDDEREKLQSLRDKQAELQQRTQADVASCRARFPDA